MKYIKSYLIGALLLLSLPIVAQTMVACPNRIDDELHPKRLFIGDKVDLNAFVWNNVRNYPGGKIKLSDFKGKYIILDFWTKYCSSCIAAFPKMNRLQEQFKDDIQILLITKNSVEELKTLFAKSSVLKETKLPMIIGDSILARELFPHGQVPYHVWLDPKGKVIATTYAQETTKQHLEALINGKPIDLLVRNEIFDTDLIRDVNNQNISFLKIGNGMFLKNLNYYSKLPVPRSGNTLPEKAVHGSNNVLSQLPTFPYYSLFMNYISGDIPNGYKRANNSTLKNREGKEIGLRLFNRSIDDLYKDAYIDSGVTIAKIITEGKANLLYEEITDTTNVKRHLIANSYSYESCVPDYSFEKARLILQLDLSHFFGMTATVEERQLKHLVLMRLNTPNEKNLWSKMKFEDDKSILEKEEGILFKNVGLGALIVRLSAANCSMSDPIFLNETGFTPKELAFKKIDILLKCKDLNCNQSNISKVRTELARYGLGLREEIRSVKVLLLNNTLGEGI